MKCAVVDPSSMRSRYCPPRRRREVDPGTGWPSPWGEVAFAAAPDGRRVSEKIGSRKGAKMASNNAQAVQAPGSVCPPVIGGNLPPDR
jgi:hypothetical protein